MSGFETCTTTVRTFFKLIFMKYQLSLVPLVIQFRVTNFIKYRLDRKTDTPVQRCKSSVADPVRSGLFGSLGKKPDLDPKDPCNLVFL